VCVYIYICFIPPVIFISALHNATSCFTINLIPHREWLSLLIIRAYWHDTRRQSVFPQLRPVWAVSRLSESVCYTELRQAKPSLRVLLAQDFLLWGGLVRPEGPFSYSVCTIQTGPTATVYSCQPGQSVGMSVAAMPHGSCSYFICERVVPQPQGSRFDPRSLHSCTLKCPWARHWNPSCSPVTSRQPTAP